MDGGLQRDRSLHGQDGRRQVGWRGLHRPDPRSTSSGGCSAPFATGSTVTLTAVPDAGSHFNSFLDCSSPASPCTVKMDYNRTVWSAFCPDNDVCFPPL